jgi:pilus assembly protein CpaB
VRPTQLISSLVRAFRWHRRWFAAILAAVAIFAATNVISTRSGGEVAVVVAARTIPGGTTLTPADLTTIWLPASGIAAGAFATNEALLGQEVISEVPQRGQLTAAALLTHGGGVAEGKLALPIRFGDASAASILSVGNRIDVLGAAATGDGFAVIATDVRVAAIPSSGPSGVLATQSGELVMIEVDQTQAAAISAAGAAGALSYALR